MGLLLTDGRKVSTSKGKRAGGKEEKGKGGKRKENGAREGRAYF